MKKARLNAIARGLALLDERLPMAPTMDGRTPLHQDCRELLAEVMRLRGVVRMLAAADPECESECRHCGGPVAMAVGSRTWQLLHKSDCIWANAVALLEEA
jgi:hypothetical protein